MRSDVARTGMFAGWISLVGIFGYHIGLSILAGQRVSGTTDASAIVAYYRQPVVGLASLEQFPVAAIMLVFVFALRETLSASGPRARFFATLGLLFAVVELPVILVETSLEAALVTAATAGGDVVGLFRFWDVVYNSAAYVTEAAWVLCFGLAMRDDAAFPRWLTRFSYLVALLQLVNMTAIWIGIPDAATLAGNMLLAVWLAASSVGLGRAVARPVSAVAAA